MKALQLCLFEGVERVRVATREGVADGSVVREVAAARPGYHGRLALVRFDGFAPEASAYAGCLLIVDLASAEHLTEFVPLATFQQEEAARVALSVERVEQAGWDLRARYRRRGA